MHEIHVSGFEGDPIQTECTVKILLDAGRNPPAVTRET
jgi:hypothetical protein